MVENNELRRAGRPRAFAPDEVLDKVIDVFWEFGYAASDTETLARRAGLTKPSLYNTFGSKEDLFVAAIQRYKQTSSEASFKALTRASTPKEGIRDYFLNLAQSIAGPNHPSGCLILSIAMPLRDQLPKVAAVLDVMFRESHMYMTTYFDMQKNEGKLPQNFDSAAATELLQDLSAAMIMQARTGASLNKLKNKAIRNTELVLFEGNTTQS